VIEVARLTAQLRVHRRDAGMAAAVRFAFTFVIPLALVTTDPTMALLGTLRPATGLRAVAGALVFAGVARLGWRRAIAHYTPASS
jgi:ABC-2 type transport system permease protein